jgi:coproporphyrinogen III oxidase
MNQPQAQNSADIRTQWVETCQKVQTGICDGLAALDGTEFSVEPWQKQPGEMLQGGGIMRRIKGELFEKGGVNFSEVHGIFPESFRKEIPGAVESDGHFWASGVSLVIHPRSPRVPIVHANIRRIETSKTWFGGGADLTPVIPHEEDTILFHNLLKTPCEAHHAGAYAEYKKWCDEYFYIKHRNEPRGVGGIFIDNLDSGDEAADFKLMEGIAAAFLEGYTTIVKRRMDESWSEEDTKAQLVKRAKYVEFNLLYDRGTRFGFQSGGNPEAILMSMPPLVAWE